jgi:uncharacterized protein (UPF0332 family)
MSTSVTEIIGFAQELLEVPPESPVSEVILRCSTSRAYYAAMHAASQALPQELQLSFDEKRGKSSHQIVIDAVVLWGKSIRPGREAARIVARNLPRLKDARKHADYRLDEDFSPEHARRTLSLAIATVDSAQRAAEQGAPRQA